MNPCDGLPVLEATEDAVNGMLDVMRMEPEHVVARAFATVPLVARDVAHDAVAAGCLPAYFPVVVAALRAVCQPAFNLAQVLGCTGPAAPVLIVNGPIRHAIDLNCGRGCMGPGWRANATIGRAVRFGIQRASTLQGTRQRSTHGMPGKLSFCFGEWEERHPWPALHVERGFRSGQSTVTVVAGQGTANNLALYLQPENIVHIIADSMRCFGYDGYRSRSGSPLVVLSAGHAQLFCEHGWDRKRLQRAVFEQAHIPRGRMPPERLAGGASYDDAPPTEPCPPCASHEDIVIAVAGGPEGYHIAHIPGRAGSSACTEEIHASARGV